MNLDHVSHLLMDSLPTSHGHQMSQEAELPHTVSFLQIKENGREQLDNEHISRSLVSTQHQEEVRIRVWKIIGEKGMQPSSINLSLLTVPSSTDKFSKIKKLGKIEKKKNPVTTVNSFVWFTVLPQ